MNNTGKKTAMRAVILLFTGLLLSGGCKDLFHPEGPKDDNHAPAAPSSVSASAQSSSSIRISWESVSGASGYYVYRATTYYGTYSYVTSTSNTFYTDTGLSSGAMYYYKVSAYNDYGTSSQSYYDYATALVSQLPSDLSLDASLRWINNNTVEGGAYTVILRNNETIAPKTLSYGGKNVSVTLSGGSAERRVGLSSTGSLLTVGSGVTLVLDNNVTLQGRSNNAASLVTVESGGTLVMENGSKITGNSTSGEGGGVFSYGAIVMNGGIISNNTSGSYGGGIVSSGSFTMNGGTISGNVMTSSSAGGGGVVTVGGSFIMTGGTISGNTAPWGSGALIWSGNNVDILGTFLKTGGVIYGSDASEDLRNAPGYAVAVEGAAYNDSGNLVSNPIAAKKRNTTAGAGVTLNSAISGSAGGWE
jgi:hypothetical protein